MNILLSAVLLVTAVSSRAESFSSAAETGESIVKQARAARTLAVRPYADSSNAFVISGCDSQSNSRRRSVASEIRKVAADAGKPAGSPVMSETIGSPAFPEHADVVSLMTRILSERSVDGRATLYSIYEFRLSDGKAPEPSVSVKAGLATLGQQGALVFFTHDNCGIPARR